jgi:hypothetical protein
MSDLIILSIHEGLGNRLFQLARNIAYSVKYNKKIVLSNNHYFNNIHSDIDYIPIFFKNIDIIKDDDIPTNIYRINEPTNGFTKYYDVPYIDRPILFWGYYQSYKYFEDIKDIIYNRYSCPDKSELYNKYDNLHNGFFIHIRRKDYINTKYDILENSYYYKDCINMALNINGNAHFYLMSDDIEWCRNSSIFKELYNVEYVDDNEVNCLWIMQLCKLGGICANSTLSWWGGWLNVNTYTNSLVMYPNIIMKNMNNDLNDFLYYKFKIMNI